MMYNGMPLYPALPGERDSDACVRVPVFGEGGRGPGRFPDECHCRRVTIENPCRPGEVAEVLLGVDACGNLVVCVKRDPVQCCRPRPPRPCPPNPPCCNTGRGRLYGSWR